MTYRIRFQNDGSLHDSYPKTFEEARIIAVSLSHWNQRVEIVDIDTDEILKVFAPYSEEGAAQLELMHIEHNLHMEKIIQDRKVVA